MALRVRRTSSIKVRVTTTLMMVFALVAQPLYGLMTDQVVGALSADEPIVDTIDNDKPTALLQFAAIGDVSFKVAFSENVNKDDAENAGNYFLENWSGAGGSGDLTGDATVVYDAAAKTAIVTLTNNGWYVSPEQKWGVRNIRDTAGNVLNETFDYSTPMTKPIASDVNGTATGKDIAWTWTGVDPNSAHTSGATGNSGIKNYQYRLTQGATVVQDWTTTSDTAVTTTVTDDDSYELYVRVIDNAGNTSDDATSNSALVDTKAPDLTIDIPIQNADGTYHISGTTTDIATPVIVRLNGDIVDDKIIAEATGAWTVGLGALIAGKTYVVTANSVDGVGNSSVQKESNYDTPAVQTSTIPSVEVIAVLASLNLPTPLSQSRSTALTGSNSTTSATQQEVAAQNAAVLGTQDKAETPLANTAVITPSSQGWKIFSMAWYWWLLIIIAAMAAWMQIAAGIRRLRGADDL